MYRPSWRCSLRKGCRTKRSLAVPPLVTAALFTGSHCRYPTFQPPAPVDLLPACCASHALKTLPDDYAWVDVAGWLPLRFGRFIAGRYLLQFKRCCEDVPVAMPGLPSCGSHYACLVVMPVVCRGHCGWLCPACRPGSPYHAYGTLRLVKA